MGNGNKLLNIIKKNIILVIMIFITLLYIIITLYIKFKDVYIEPFINNIYEMIIDSHCPNYCAFDGENYYLVYNNKEFGGINNPIIVNSREKVIEKCNELKCNSDVYLNNLIILRRKTDHDDPTVNLKRKCNKHIAPFNYGINKCVFNYAHSTKELNSDIKTNIDIKDIKNTSLLDYDNIKLTNVNEQSVDVNDQNKSLDNYKNLRKLIQFINQDDESVMVDYDLETCMFEKIGDLYNKESNIPDYLKNGNVISHEDLHKFRKSVNSINVGINRDTDIEVDGVNMNDSSMNEIVVQFNKSNKVISDKLINELYDD